jgi:hypothetical protein
MHSKKDPAVQCYTVSNLREMETLRPYWDAWSGSRDTDFDLFSARIRALGPSARPHIIVATRNSVPEALLVGFWENRSLPVRVGFAVVYTATAEVLEFLPNGIRGNRSEEIFQALIQSADDALEQGEADVVWWRNVEVKSLFHDCVSRSVPLLFSDCSGWRETHWLMQFPEGAKGMFARLNRKQRSKMARKYKRFKTYFTGRMEVRCFTREDELEEAMAAMEAIADKSDKRLMGFGFFQSETAKATTRVMAAKGWLRIFVLYVAGCPVAFWMGSIYEGCLKADNVGYDAAWRKFSPGTFLFLEILENLREQEIETVDFGHGDMQFKRSFGESAREESTIEVYAPTLRGIRLNLLFATARRSTTIIQRISSLRTARRALWKHSVNRRRRRHAIQLPESRAA